MRLFINKHQGSFVYGSFALIAIAIHCLFLWHGWLFAANDMQFHLHEINELRQNISHGSLNPLIATFAFNNNGNAVISLYPKWPLYLYAFAQMLFKDSIRGIFIADMIKTFLGLVIAFYSVKSIKKDNLSAYLFALLYMTSNMVLAYDYQTMDIGVMWSLIWIPLVFAGFYQWLKTGKWVGLAIGLSGILLSHILTFVIVLFSLVVLTLFNYKVLFSLKRWQSLFKGAILAGLLSSLTWVPLIYFTLITPVRYWTPSVPYGLTGTAFKNIFQFFTINNASMYLGLGSLLGIVVSLVNFKRMSKFQIDLFVLGLLLILLQSQLIPWKNLADTPLSVIQFPWRLLIIPLVCFSYLLVVNSIAMIRRLDFHYSPVGIAVIGTVLFVGSALLRSEQFIKSQINTQEINYRVVAQRGVPMDQNGQQIYKVTNEAEYQNLLGYSISWDYYPVKTCNGTTLPRTMQHQGFNLANGETIPMSYRPKPDGIYFEFNLTGKRSNIELPFVAYDHRYQVRLNGKNVSWQISPSGVIQLNHLTSGSYRVDVQYHNSGLKVGMVVPFIIGVITLLVIFVKPTWLPSGLLNNGKFRH